jgi:putative ABC transport system substrate-binding protein
MLASAAAWAAPAASRAQPAERMRRIGVLSLSKAASDAARYEVAAFRAALRSTGYEEGRNLQIEARFAEGEVPRLAGLAQELVRLDVALIMAITNDPIEAAMRATRRIPIVMIGAVLPVELGYVQSLARPGANVTGTSWATIEMSGKVMQILREAAPAAVRIALLATPAAPGSLHYRAENRRAAKALGLRLETYDIGPADSLAATLRRVAANKPDALFVVGEGVVGTQLAEIAAFAQRHKLLSIGVTPQYIGAGGALYYGPNLAALMQRTVSYIDRILKGAQPADLPVELPAKFDLIVNLKTLKAIGFTIPQSLLLRADEVIQ